MIYEHDDVKEMMNKFLDRLTEEIKARLENARVPRERREIIKQKFGDYFNIRKNNLVEEPKEKKYRPYRDTDEMIADFLERCNNYSRASDTHNPMVNPLIWIKGKSYESLVLIQTISASKLEVWVTESEENHSYTMRELFDCFTYIDGSPCGKLKEERERIEEAIIVKDVL